MTSLVALVAVGVGVGQARDGMRTVGHRTGPVAISTMYLSFALSDMDAQAANVLLVADRTDLGTSRSQALATYDRRRSEVSRYLQQTAALAGTDRAGAAAVRTLLDELADFEALAAQAILLEDDPTARPGRPPARALDLYRQATDLMHQRLLPTAARLSTANATIVDTEYHHARSAVLTTRGWVAGLTGLAVATLLVAQVGLYRRTHRLVNPGFAATTLVVATVLTLGLGVLSTQAESLRVAKQDAFDSIFALAQARAVSYDANADESRYLLDPQRAARYEAAFLTGSTQLADLGDVPIGRYDGALGAALDAYRADHADVRFGGLFGSALRNITFQGERPAAERTLAAFRTYQLADRHIRALAASGRLDEAIRFCTSESPGDSNYAFAQYDAALTAFTQINQRVFDDTVQDSEGRLRPWGMVPGGTAVTAMALLFLGIRPRLAEYR